MSYVAAGFQPAKAPAQEHGQAVEIRIEREVVDAGHLQIAFGVTPAARGERELSQARQARPFERRTARVQREGRQLP